MKLSVGYRMSWTPHHNKNDNGRRYSFNNVLQVAARYDTELEVKDWNDDTFDEEASFTYWFDKYKKGTITVDNTWTHVRVEQKTKGDSVETKAFSDDNLISEKVKEYYENAGVI